MIRSLGGRKKDVKHLFNAETFIIGFCSGLLGIAITYGLSGIINLIVGSLTGVYTIAALPISSAIVMIIISILLTTIKDISTTSILSFVLLVLSFSIMMLLLMITKRTFVIYCESFVGANPTSSS